MQTRISGILSTFWEERSDSFRTLKISDVDVESKRGGGERVVQQNLTSEMELFRNWIDRSLSIFSMTYLKRQMEYFNFRC